MHHATQPWGQHLILDFAENFGQAYIDIFSCKAFDNAAAEDVCRKYFSPVTVIATRLFRGDFAADLAAVG